MLALDLAVNRRFDEHQRPAGIDALLNLAAALCRRSMIRPTAP